MDFIDIRLVYDVCNGTLEISMDNADYVDLDHIYAVFSIATSPTSIMDNDHVMKEAVEVDFRAVEDYDEIYADHAPMAIDEP